jgi:hypothetical protein
MDGKHIVQVFSLSQPYVFQPRVFTVYVMMDPTFNNLNYLYSGDAISRK